MIIAGRPGTTTHYRKSFYNKSHPGHLGWLFSLEKQRIREFLCHSAKCPLLMPRLLYALLVITAVSLAAACSKDAEKREEAVFYGTWIKGSKTGDTLRFYKKGIKDVMLSNQSFNPNMYAPIEREYRYKNGKLILGYPFMSGGLAYDTIESFTWKNTGRDFEINGFELYMFMSSSLTKFTFVKVR